MRGVESSQFIPITSSYPLSHEHEEGLPEGGNHSCLFDTPNDEERKKRPERGTSVSKLVDDNQW